MCECSVDNGVGSIVPKTKNTKASKITGIAMSILGQFTLWPQYLVTLDLKDASGLSAMTCVVGLLMSTISLSHAFTTTSFWLRLTYASNLFASMGILSLKIKYDWPSIVAWYHDLPYLPIRILSFMVNRLAVPLVELLI